MCSTSIRASPPMSWPRGATRAKVAEAIEKSDLGSAPLFSLHRKALAVLPPDAVELLTQFWVARGLFDTVEQAHQFVAAFKSAFERADRRRKIREIPLRLRLKARQLTRFAPKKLPFNPFGQKSVIACNGYLHGLGNRIRVTMGAKILAETHGRKFHYVWPTGPKFGPQLHDLWVVDDRSIRRLTSKLLSLRYPYRDASLSWLDDAAEDEQVWQIRTSHALHLPTDGRSWHEEFRALRPVREIADLVRSFHSAHFADGPYVGVMVRAHSASHTKTLEASPIDWYLDRMKEIRAASPDVKFFVSCDLPAAQQQLIDEIGNCFGLQDKGAYNSVAGVRSAVADLYLLAGSGYLLGPHYSSFVEMAQFLAGSSLVLETAGAPRSALQPRDFWSMGMVLDPVTPSKRR